MKIFYGLLLLCLIVNVASARAQTIEFEGDLDPLGFAFYTVQDVDADANPATRELLAIPGSPTEHGRFQVIAVSPTGKLCYGELFYPSAPWFARSIDLVWTGRRHVLIAKPLWDRGEPFTLQRTVRLDRPRCD